MPVGLVFVSHSAEIAAGVVALARQMAPDVPLYGAGGTDDGGIGTSAAAIERALQAADDGAGVLLIADLGSAVLTAETVVELLEDPPAAGVRVLDVPIVEGGVAAAVAAQAGGDLSTVARAAGSPGDGPEAAPAEASSPEDDADDVRIVLADPEGLHARPAAALVRAVAGHDAHVTVNGVDASSLLSVLALGLRQGATVTVRATGPGAAAARDAVVALLGSPAASAG